MHRSKRQRSGASGGGGFGLLNNQDFYAIRDWCLKRGYLFEDPYFKMDQDYEWLRPWQIVNNPKLYVGGISRFDINQGLLGDCWMLASIAEIAVRPELVQRVIPNDQSFDNQYAGIFHFRFWRFGKWIDVVIDDRLPTSNGELVFNKSLNPSEFWSALFEKAYCKVLGGEYKASDAGNLCEGLEDFTGGVVEQYMLQNVPYNFPVVLLKSIQRGTLMGTFIDDDPGSSESQTPHGLVKGHSYSLTDVKSITIPGYGNIELVRIRNPWGKHEWNGPWSDGSAEWRSVPDSTKQQLGIVCRDDGEFWMCYNDFVTQFQWLDMVHLSPDAFADDSGNQMVVGSWQLNMVKGSWVRGVTAGGAAKLYMNPQVRFALSESDDENQDGLCNVLIALMQKSSMGDNFEIGFRVYQLDDPDQGNLDKYFFHSNKSVADVPTKTVREVSGRFNLPPGTYVVIPFTYDPNLERDFLVRIYSEKASNMEQMDQGRIGHAPVEVTDEKPPMKVGADEDEKVDVEVKEFFDRVAGADKEVDWKELRQVFDIAMKEGLTPKASDPKHGIAHFLLDELTNLLNRIFGRSQPDDAWKTVGPEGFSNDLCRSMIAMMDDDHSGKLSFNEFHILWNEIKAWKDIYERFADTEGYLTSQGLKEALESAGYQLNKPILSDIVRRYSSKDGKITFDDFLHCTIKLKHLMNFFKKKGEDGKKAEFTLEEFISKTIYC